MYFDSFIILSKNILAKQKQSLEFSLLVQMAFLLKEKKNKNTLM